MPNDDMQTTWSSVLEEGGGLALWEVELPTRTLRSPGGLAGLLRLPATSLPGTLDAFLALVDSQDHARVEQLLTGGDSASADATVRFAIRHADGALTRIVARGRCVDHDDAGAPARLRGSMRDISDRALYHDRILSVAAVVGRADGSDTLQTLVRAIGEASQADLCLVTRFDNEPQGGRCRQVASWKRIPIPELPNWQVAGSPCADIRAGRPQMVAARLDELFPGHPISSVLLAKAFVGIPLFDAIGTPIGCVACAFRQPLRDDPEAVRDLVSIFAPRAAAELARQDIAADLAQSQQLLHQAEKMDALGRLAGGIAHDFNNMLAGIMGAAELLGARLGGDSPHQRLIRTIVQSADRAADLTRKLLSFSRKAPVQRRQIDLRTPIEEALAILERSIDRSIAVRRDLGAGPTVVAGDPGLLQAMVLNLCLNACDAMARGGTLTVSVSTMLPREGEDSWGLAGRVVQLMVSDTGSGMDPATAARIFEPFFTTKAAGAGTGLGLAAAYGTIQEHGGGIRVETAPGKGTTMRVRLPLLAGQGIDPPTDRLTPNQVAGRVLLVDDEDLVRQATGELLASLGWQVVHARDGEEGIRRFQENPAGFTLAVLDSIMPRMDGLGCFRGLRETRSDLPVVFCSGYTRDRTRTELPGEPRVAFVQKPFRLAELVQAIQSVRQP